MDFWMTVLVLFRRWYITLPAFVLALVAVGAVYVSRPIQYTSSSILALTPPTSGETQRADSKHAPDLTNPLLNFSQGLNNTAALLVQALGTTEISKTLGVRSNGDPSFQVTNGSNNPELLVNGPFIFITGQSTSPGKAQDIVVRVAQRAREELLNQQQHLKAPPSTYIVLFEIVPPTTPEGQNVKRLRPAAVTLAVGVFASVAAAFVAESILTRPRSRRRAESATGGRIAVEGAEPTAAAAPAEPSLFLAAQLPADGPAVSDGERQDRGRHVR